MNEKKYKKRLEFQQKMIRRQSEQIQDLESQVQKLQDKIHEKDELINSVTDLREELKQNVTETRAYKEQYRVLIDELRKMKSILNKDVFHGKWKIIYWLIKL